MVTQEQTEVAEVRFSAHPLHCIRDYAGLRMAQLGKEHSLK